MEDGHHPKIPPKADKLEDITLVVGLWNLRSREQEISIESRWWMAAKTQSVLV